MYHALNRSVGGMHLLRNNADFQAFQHDVIEALWRDPIRIPSSCVLSNHWHFVVWPGTDGRVTKKKGLIGAGSFWLTRACTSPYMGIMGHLFRDRRDEWNETAHPFHWTTKSAAKIMAKCQSETSKPLATVA